MTDTIHALTCPTAVAAGAPKVSSTGRAADWKHRCLIRVPTLPSQVRVTVTNDPLPPKA